MWHYENNKWNKITDYYAQLPTPDLSMNTLYVDTYFNKVFLYDNNLINARQPLGWELKQFYQQENKPETGNDGEIYIDVSVNKVYYWNPLWQAPSIPIGWSELLVNNIDVTDIYTNANDSYYIHFSNKFHNGIQLGWQIKKVISELPNNTNYDIFIDVETNTLLKYNEAIVDWEPIKQVTYSENRPNAPSIGDLFIDVFNDKFYKFTGDLSPAGGYWKQEEVENITHFFEGVNNVVYVNNPNNYLYNHNFSELITPQWDIIVSKITSIPKIFSVVILN